MYQYVKSKRDISRADSIVIRWPVLYMRPEISAPYAGAVFYVIVGCAGVCQNDSLRGGQRLQFRQHHAVTRQIVHDFVIGTQQNTYQ